MKHLLLGGYDLDITTILFPVLSIGSMGLLFGLGLGYAGLKFKVDEDPNLPLIREALPGANCGGCGFPGCDGFASAMCKGEAQPNGCPVGGTDTTLKISAILGVKAEILQKQSAFVKCAGDCNKSTFQYDYSGLSDCSAAMQLAAGGAKACAYGCLGAGSCTKACNFGAINLIDGIAVVDKEKCTSCKKCIESCPKNLIELVPYESKTRVICNSKDNGKIVRNNCSVGCIGCKLCEKACKFDAIRITDMIAKIDYTKCTQCNECVKKCPTSAVTV